MKNAFRLNIKDLRFKSVLKSGSAYLVLVDGNDVIEVIVSSSWRNQKYLIKLKRIVIDETIEFPASMLTSFAARITIPDMKTNFSNLILNSFKASVVHSKTKIINISYPN